MDDLEVAHLVLITASSADGGCVPCVQGSVDEAIFRYPDLPWEEAIADIRPESRQLAMRIAVKSARSWINDGNQPRHEDLDDEVDLSVQGGH